MTTQFDAKIRSKNYDTNDDNGRVEEHSRRLRSIENNDIGDGRERSSRDSRTNRREETARGARSEIHPERSLRRLNERTERRRTDVEMHGSAGSRSGRGRIYERNIHAQGRNGIERHERTTTADSERATGTVKSFEDPRRDFNRAANARKDTRDQMISHIRAQEQIEDRRENNNDQEQRINEDIIRMPRIHQRRREEENDEDIRRDTEEENGEEQGEDRQLEKRIRTRRDIERSIRNIHSDRNDVRGKISGLEIDNRELQEDLYEENKGRSADRSRESRLQRVSEIVRKNAESRLRLSTRDYNRNENLESKQEDRLDSRAFAHRNRVGQQQRLRRDQDRQPIEAREYNDISRQMDSIPRRISDRVDRVSAEVRRNVMKRARSMDESDLRQSVDSATDTESSERRFSEESRNRRQNIQDLRRNRNERNSQREAHRINERDSIDERRESIDDQKTTVERSRDSRESDLRRSVDREVDAESSRRQRSEESRNRRQDVHNLRRNRNERNSERDTRRINERDYIEERRALIDERKTNMERSRYMKESGKKRSFDRVKETEFMKRQLSEESTNRRQQMLDLRRNRNERNEEREVRKINERDSNEENRRTIEARDSIIEQARAVREYDSKRAINRELDTESNRRQHSEESTNRRQNMHDLRRNRNERNSEHDEHKMNERDSNEKRRTSINAKRTIIQQARATRDTDSRRSVDRELEMESNRRHLSDDSSNRRQYMHESRRNTNERNLEEDEYMTENVNFNEERRPLIDVRRSTMERGRNTRELDSRRSAERVMNTQSNGRQSQKRTQEVSSNEERRSLIDSKRNTMEHRRNTRELDSRRSVEMALNTESNSKESQKRYDMDESRRLVGGMHIVKDSREDRQERTEEGKEDLRRTASIKRIGVADLQHRRNNGLIRDRRNDANQVRMLPKSYGHLEIAPKSFYQFLSTPLDCSKTFA